ncbi:MAG TPA: response regulator transcription factor [Candidatus Sulfotelmatobacter sp.]|nr:response regulator transcription factor [Candidatus Sulfotelmatobacter sp.]
MPKNQKLFSSRPAYGGHSRHVKSEAESRAAEVLYKQNSSIEAGALPEPSLTITECKVPKKRTSLLSVLVADDHPVVREGLVSLINREPDMRVVAQASNGREAIENFFQYHPDVALLDLRMSVLDGIGALIAIVEREPCARVGIITSYQLEEEIYRALRAGALGYILKDATADQIKDCIRAVADGKAWVPPQVGARLARRVADQELTRREIQVLNAVTAGKSNKEIGAVFDISEATVKVHVTHILEKLRVTGRTEAINVAIRRGLVRLDMSAAA